MPPLSQGVSASHPLPWEPWSRAHHIPCQTEAQCVPRVCLLQNSLPFHCPAQEIEKVKISIFCLNSCCDSVSDRSLFFPPSGAESELGIQSREADNMEQFGCAAGQGHFATSTPLWPRGQAALGPGPERPLVSCRLEKQASLAASLSRSLCLPARYHGHSPSLALFLHQPGLPSLITSWLCSLLSQVTAHLQRKPCSVAGDLWRCHTLTLEGSGASRALTRPTPRSLSTSGPGLSHSL